MAKCIKCDHEIYAGVCNLDTCKCICESDHSYEVKA